MQKARAAVPVAAGSLSFRASVTMRFAIGAGGKGLASRFLATGAGRVQSPELQPQGPADGPGGAGQDTQGDPVMGGIEQPV